MNALDKNRAQLDKLRKRMGEYQERLKAEADSQKRAALKAKISFSLALQTGMPLYFYYRYCFQGQQVGGVSRYNYELSRRREAGVPADEAARRTGGRYRTPARWPGLSGCTTPGLPPS